MAEIKDDITINIYDLRNMSGCIFSAPLRGVNSERNFARWTQGLCHFGVRVLLGVLSALADSWGRLMTRFERSEASN